MSKKSPNDVRHEIIKPKQNLPSTQLNESLPVLGAFNDFIKEERIRARNRMLIMAAFFTLIIIIIVGLGMFIGMMFFNKVDSNLLLTQHDLNTYRRKTENYQLKQEKQLSKIQKIAADIAETVAGQKKTIIATQHSVSSNKYSYQQELKDMKQALTSLSKKNENLKQNITSLSKENKNLKQDVKKSQKQIPTLTTQIKDLLTAVEKLKKENAAKQVTNETGKADNTLRINKKRPVKQKHTQRIIPAANTAIRKIPSQTPEKVSSTAIPLPKIDLDVIEATQETENNIIEDKSKPAPIDETDTGLGIPHSLELNIPSSTGSNATTLHIPIPE